MMNSFQKVAKIQFWLNQNCYQINLKSTQKQAPDYKKN
jgi:hypothetical protein